MSSLILIEFQFIVHLWILYDLEFFPTQAGLVELIKENVEVSVIFNACLLFQLNLKHGLIY